MGTGNALAGKATVSMALQHGCITGSEVYPPIKTGNATDVNQFKVQAPYLVV